MFDGNEERRAEVRKQMLFLFLGAWLFYLAFLPPGIYSIDGNSMLTVADSLVTHHNMTVPDGTGMLGIGGRSYSPWYPLQSVLAVPLVGAAIKASGAFHLPLRYVEAFSVTPLPALYTAATVALVYLLALMLGSEAAGAWLAAMAYGFGTIALVYTRDFYADPLLALLAAGALVLAFRERVSGWIVLLTALAVLAKPTGVIVGAVLSVYLLWRTRRFWVSLLPGLGTAIGLSVYFAYNFYRFGKVTTFGPDWGFSIRNVPEGLAGLLISPSAGVIWYCPCVLLCVAALWQMKAPRKEAWAIVAMAGASLLLHSIWREWLGGSSWGPRLLLPVLPGLVALTGVLRGEWRKVLAATAVLGFLLTAPNLVSFCYKRHFAEAGEHGLTAAEVRWEPRQSLLLRAWPLTVDELRDARNSDVRQLVQQRSDTPASTIATSRALRIVAVWWWVLPVVHVSRVWGIVLSTILAVGGIWLLAASGLAAAKADQEHNFAPAQAQTGGFANRS